MTKVVSIIPSKGGRSGTRVQGTKVLLDNGEYLRCVSKVTLIADMDHGLWKAVLEVFPTNQQQIDAVLLEMITAPNQDVICDRADQIQKDMNNLFGELVSLVGEEKAIAISKAFDCTGVVIDASEGTYLLRQGEMVITPEQNKTLQEQLDKVTNGHGKAAITSFSINGEKVCPDHADNTDVQT